MSNSGEHGTLATIDNDGAGITRGYIPKASLLPQRVYQRRVQSLLAKTDTCERRGLSSRTQTQTDALRGRRDDHISDLEAIYLPRAFLLTFELLERQTLMQTSVATVTFSCADTSIFGKRFLSTVLQKTRCMMFYGGGILLTKGYVTKCSSTAAQSAYTVPSLNHAVGDGRSRLLVDACRSILYGYLRGVVLWC